MDAMTLENIQKQIDELLKKRGIEPDKIELLRKKLVREMKEKERKLLAEGIVKEVQKQIKEVQKQIEEFVNKKMGEIERQNQENRKEIVEGIKSVKIEPRIEVSIPEIEIPPIEPPKIPPIKVDVPRPSVIVNPPEVKVKIPETRFPKEMKIAGIDNLIKKLENLILRPTEWTRDSPMPAILVDEKGGYAKLGGGIVSVGGGRGGIVDLKLDYQIHFKEVDVSTIGDNTIIPGVPEVALRRLLMRVGR